jgi:SnoaL-like domain
VSVEEIEAILRRALDASNSADLAGMDAIALDIVMHLRCRSDAAGFDAYRGYNAAPAQRPSRSWVVPEDLLAKGDKAVLVCTLRGELMGGAPTGKELTVTSTSVYRVADGNENDRMIVLRCPARRMTGTSAIAPIIPSTCFRRGCGRESPFACILRCTVWQVRVGGLEGAGT